MMNRQTKIGIIGAGRIGQVHAESLTQRIPAAHVLIVSDVNASAAATTAEKYRIPLATGDYRDVLNHPDVEAVLICSSTDTHAPFIVEAAAAQKHIFCEKPIALDLPAIDQALAAVSQNKVLLQIGFNRRFDSNFRYLHEAVKTGKIGAPHFLRITSRDPAPPPLPYILVSGGIFLDMTIHDFDLARYLMGSEVKEIYATGSVLVDPAIGTAGDIDTAVITLRFNNGAIGVIDNSRQAVYGYDQRAEVFGSAGAVEAHNKTPHNTLLSTAESVCTARPLYFFLERYMDAYVAEIQSFIAAIQNESPVAVSGEDGRQATLLGLAAWRSYHERRPVKLSEVS
jgi:myo-inositol 2-dehydrogenase/D-chiro-inositol 1-dehydrogenase